MCRHRTIDAEDEDAAADILAKLLMIAIASALSPTQAEMVDVKENFGSGVL
jgi:hypothetical protein